MNRIKFHELYDVQIAQRADINSIRLFYGANWASGHILANDINFLLFEHLEDERFNFVIAKDNNDGEIIGAIGFTDYGSLNGLRHITSTMLTVSPKCKTPLLGIHMISELKNLTKASSYCGVTTNPITLAPYVKRYLHHYSGSFDHLYVVNSNFNQYKIIGGNVCVRDLKYKKPLVTLIEIYHYESILGLKCIGNKQKNLPYKGLAYLNRRYFSHPIFKYRFFKILNHIDGGEAFIVAKVEVVSESSIFRIIDFIGPLEMINDISYALYDLVRFEGHEYADLFCTNASSFIKEDNCFYNKAETNCVVPHYFYPYYKENIQVLYETDCPNLVFFKGDGDGDRPNYR